MSCIEHPTMLQETWDTIGNADWNDGGWIIDGNQYRIVLHITPNNTQEWVAWKDDPPPPPPPPPPPDIVCTMSEDDYNLIKGGDLDPSSNSITKGDNTYCVSHVDVGGDHYAKVILDE